MNKLIYAMLEVTNHCNLNCRFCNRRNIIKEKRHISLYEWKYIMEKLSMHPIKEVKLQGIGEPFMNPQMSDISKEFKKWFPNAKSIMATNCQYKINNNFINTLPYIDLLYLSVDGYEDTYERDREGAKWSKLIQFLDDFKTITIPDNLEVTINYVVHNDNYHDIDRIYEMVSKKYNYIDNIRLNIAQWWQENEIIDESYNENFYKTLKKYKKDVKGKSPWTFSDCFWPKGGIFIDAFGDVRICCMNTSTKHIGNIFTDELDIILNNNKRKSIRKMCESDIPHIHCKSCDYKRLSPILDRIRNG